MGIIDEIKKGAEKNGTKIQSSEAAQLEKIFNKITGDELWTKNSRLMQFEE